MARVKMEINKREADIVWLALHYMIIQAQKTIDDCKDGSVEAGIRDELKRAAEKAIPEYDALAERFGRVSDRLEKLEKKD